MKGKVTSFKQTVFLSEHCVLSKLATSVQRPTIILTLAYCPVDTHCCKSGQKFAVQMCRVATVAMETTQPI